MSKTTCTTNPVAAAVAPRREAVVARSMEVMREHLTAVAQKLQGTDLSVVAAYPDSFRTNQEQYKRQQAFYSLARQVVTYTASDRPGASAPVTGLNEEGIERLVKQAGEEAAFSFDKYVAKLTAKVGECDAAEVVGPLWGHSVLTVRKGATVESWKTQQIVNVSCLGKLFNQWPTRKMK